MTATLRSTGLPTLGITPIPPIWTRSVVCLQHCLDVSSVSGMSHPSLLSHCIPKAGAMGCFETHVRI